MTRIWGNSKQGLSLTWYMTFPRIGSALSGDPNSQRRGHIMMTNIRTSIQDIRVNQCFRMQLSTGTWNHSCWRTYTGLNRGMRGREGQNISMNLSSINHAYHGGHGMLHSLFCIFSNLLIDYGHPCRQLKLLANWILQPEKDTSLASRGMTINWRGAASSPRLREPLTERINNICISQWLDQLAKWSDRAGQFGDHSEIKRVITIRS